MQSEEKGAGRRTARRRGRTRSGALPLLGIALLHVTRGTPVIARAAHLVATGAAAVSLVVVVAGLAHFFALFAAVVVASVHAPIGVVLAVLAVILTSATISVLAPVTVALLFVPLRGISILGRLHGRGAHKKQAHGKGAQRQRFQHIFHTHKVPPWVGISPIASLRQLEPVRKMAAMLWIFMLKSR